MTREELVELHYITPTANVASILAHGVLSHERASQLRHASIAMEEIQDRRRRVRVPGGRPLHQYVNLYIHARNPMLFLRRDRHEELCILRISPAVLDLPGVIVADRNASSDHVRFGPAPSALALVDRDRVLAEYWTHPNDQIEEWRHKSIKCAEVLVPDQVDRAFVIEAYVSCAQSHDGVLRLAPTLQTFVNARLFFR